MRAAQLPNSDRTAITLFLTLLGHEIIKMNIFQPRHKREFPRELLNQPESGSRDFFSLLISLCHQVWQQHLSRGCSNVVKSSPLPVLWHTAWKGTENLSLIRNIFCQKAKFRQILPNWAFFSPSLCWREKPHTLLIAAANFQQHKYINNCPSHISNRY